MLRMSLINAPVQVTIGGQPAQVTFQGVAPGFAGLEQLTWSCPRDLGPAISRCSSPSTEDPAMPEWLQPR